MKRTLLLHGGMPKTGTTSIQNACHAARETILEKEGILYPGIAANHTNVMCTLFMANPAQHISNRMANRTSDSAIAQIQAEYRKSLEADLARDGWDRVLISAEGISNLSREELSEIRNFFADYVDDFDVIYYVREPLAYTASVMQQLLKGGQTLAALHKKPDLPNFRGKIGNALEAFGTDAVRVRDFGQGVKVPGGLVADFCMQMEMGDETLEAVLAESQLDNESLSLEAARMLSQLNSLRPLFDEKGRASNRTGRETLSFETIQGNKFQPPLAVRQRIWKQTRGDVAWLNETFGTDLFNIPEPDGADAPDPEKQAQAARSTVTLISDLLNTVEALSACLQARNLAESGHSKAAEAQIRRALRACPDHPLVRAEAKKIDIRPSKVVSA